MVSYKALNTFVVLKMTVLIEPLWNWNQRGVITPCKVQRVLIEPLWNWNVLTGERGVPEDISLNRTFMELKRRSYGNSPSGPSVLIEPLWNWNRKHWPIWYAPMRVLIEPLWNWNTTEGRGLLLTDSLNRTFMELKLQTMTALSPPSLGLNRTFMELKLLILLDLVVDVRKS